MPLIYKERLPGSSQLGVWKIEEKLDQLETVYPLLEEEEYYFNKVTNEKRKREWLIARVLLTEILEKRVVVNYNKHGKPYIENSTINISITHSKNHVAILISSKLVPGVDVEFVSERVSKVKHKFLDEDELSWCDSLEKMTICWSAKEAIYKTFGKELDFHDIQIPEFNSEDGFFNANIVKLDKAGVSKVFFERFDDDVLTYTFRAG